MAPNLSKKRKLEEGMKGKLSRPSKKIRKQRTYSSGSSSPSPSPTADEFQPVDLADSDTEPQPRGSVDTNQSSHKSDTSSTSNASTQASDSESSPSTHKHKPSKRHDPLAFSTSLQKILSTKLTTSKRSDPVLARSKDAQLASQELNEGKLEAKARRTMREEKRREMDRGRVRDVLLGDRKEILGLEVRVGDKAGGAGVGINGDGNDEEMTAAEIAEQERRLRKTAQRGVVKLFNAVRAAQVKAEEAAREVKSKGVVGVGRREEKISEMSKKGFLELVAGGGGDASVRKGRSKSKAGTIEQA